MERSIESTQPWSGRQELWAQGPVPRVPAFSPHSSDVCHKGLSVAHLYTKRFKEWNQLILHSLCTKHFMCFISLKVLKKLYEAGIDRRLTSSPIAQLGSHSLPCCLPVCEDVQKRYRDPWALSQQLVKASIWLTPLQWFLQKPGGQGPSWEWVISRENSLVYLEREGGSILPRVHTCIQVAFLFLTSLSGQE